MFLAAKRAASALLVGSIGIAPSFRSAASAAREDKDSEPFPFLTKLTASNFADVVLDPRRDVAVEAYLTDCPMCMALAPRVRCVAYMAHRGFFNGAGRIPISVAAMNVDETERPREWMPGPSFPTIQLFNAGGEAAKTTGAGCKSFGGHWVPPAVSVPETPAIRHIGLASAGSPPCVPALDFTHPTKRERMALPSVPELVLWLARHCSMPFDPHTVRVPASEILPPEDAVATSSISSAVPVPLAPGATVSLMDLAEDMEADARRLENHVFEYLWLDHISTTYYEQYVSPPSALPAAPPARGSSASELLAAAEATLAARAAAAGGPPLSSADAAAARLRAARLAELVEAARAAVVDRGFYRRVAAGEAALDAAQAFVEAEGMLDAVRRGTSARAEAKRELAAVHVARAMLA